MKRIVRLAHYTGRPRALPGAAVPQHRSHANGPERGQSLARGAAWHRRLLSPPKRTEGASTINQSPTWQFAVIAAASENLGLVYPMNGQTRRAKSILSWGLEPTGCDYSPIWGNALNYRIRLDQ